MIKLFVLLVLMNGDIEGVVSFGLFDNYIDCQKQGQTVQKAMQNSDTYRTIEFKCVSAIEIDV